MITLSGPTGRLVRQEVLKALAAHAAQNENADPSMTVKQLYGMIHTCEWQKDLAVILSQMLEAGDVDLGRPRLPGEPGGMERRKGGRPARTYQIAAPGRTQGKAPAPATIQPAEAEDALAVGPPCITASVDLMPDPTPSAPPSPPTEATMPSHPAETTDYQAETDAGHDSVALIQDSDWLIQQLEDRAHQAAPWSAVDIARLRALADAPVLDRYPDWSLYLRGLAARMEIESV